MKSPLGSTYQSAAFGSMHVSLMVWLKSRALIAAVGRSTFNTARADSTATSAFDTDLDFGRAPPLLQHANNELS